MLKILKFAAYYEVIKDVIDIFKKSENNIGKTFEVRPSYKGREFSISIKRTK